MEKIAVAAFSLLLGVVGIWTALARLRDRRELNRWPSTKGRVVERGTFRANWTMSAPAFQHAPLVRYAYRVGGAEFVNDSINPKRVQLPGAGTLRWAERRAASFPDEVTVYYNPADPAESFLVQTPKVKLYMVIAGACCALLFGALFCLTN